MECAGEVMVADLVPSRRVYVTALLLRLKTTTTVPPSVVSADTADSVPSETVVCSTVDPGDRYRDIWPM